MPAEIVIYIFKMFKYGLILLALVWGADCAGKQLVGPYDVVFHKIYECEGMPTGRDIMKYRPKFEVYNRSAILFSSNITLPNGLRDSMNGLVDISVLTNGVWRKNYINLRFNHLCSEFNRLFPKLLPSLVEAAGAKYTECPIKSGTYVVRNWTFNLQTATGVFPYNTYKAEGAAVESGRKVGCMNIEVTIVPKP